MENTISDKEELKKKTEKMNMADRFVTAMFLPGEYNKLLHLSAGKLIQFILVLILLVSVVRYAVPALGAIAGMGGVKNIVLNEIPEFSLENGKFTLSEKLERTDEINGIYMVIDTSVEKYTREDVPENMVEAIMISRTNILFYNQVFGMGGMVQDNKLEDLKEIVINNQTIAEMAPVIYGCLLFLFLFMYGFEMIKYLVIGLFYAIVMQLLTKVMMADLTFGEIYKTAMYAQAIGAIVNAVMYCLDVPILILTGSSFAMLITIVIMNKVFIQLKMQSEL